MRSLSIFLLIIISGCSSTEESVNTQPVANTAELVADQKPSPSHPVLPEPQDMVEPYLDVLTMVMSKADSATTEDYYQLRLAYAHSDIYKPYFAPESIHIENGFSSMNQEEWQACADHAAKAIAINYTNLNAQYLGMACFFELGNVEQGERHRHALDGLIDSIWSTGDGKSQQTALHTYTTPELRAFIHLHGLEIVNQSLINGEQGVFDLMGVKNPETGEEIELYFNITHQFSRGISGLTD